MAFNISNPNAPKKNPYQQQRQPQQRQPQQQQYGQPQNPQQYMQRAYSQNAVQQQRSAQYSPHSPVQDDDNKDQEAKKLLEAKQRAILKNEDIHFNFFDEAQYGISNFPKALSEIGILCSKIKKKGLIVSCGSGRLVFEMSKHFNFMDGIDTNGDLIETANSFKTKQMIAWEIPNHGDILDRYKATAFKDLKCDKATLSKCNFAEIKDYHTVPLSYNKYDCIIILNVLDKLHSPKKFVNTIQRRVNKGGILIFCECFNWNENVTQKIKWIGGTANKSSSDGLKEMLRTFTVIKEDKMSFIKRKNAFLFQLSIANTIILKKT